MAIINKIGWDIGVKKSCVICGLFKRTEKVASENGIISKFDADELLCLPYLKAIDNYFEISSSQCLSTSYFSTNIINSKIGIKDFD